MTRSTVGKSRLFVISAIAFIHGGRPHSVDVRRDSDVRVPEEFHALNLFLGPGARNDAGWARTRGKASSHVGGWDRADFGVRSTTSSN